MVKTTQATTSTCHGTMPGKVIDGGTMAMNMPTVKSSESPGRMGKMAHSMKMMSATPHRAQFPRAWMMTAGSSHSGRSSGTMASWGNKSMITQGTVTAMVTLSDDEVAAVSAPGVGPHPLPWPDGEQYDLALLAEGDRRNVGDSYRYLTVEAIVADLDTRRQPLHVAIQNWEHDFNIGSIVRTANAFNVAAVHIVGRRRWNRRGAMVTDRYLHVHHHPDEESFLAWLDANDVVAVGVDNIPGSVPLETAELPQHCCLVFGSEGPGLTDTLAAGCTQLVAITQYGSTRSLNAGAAAAIAMYHWARQWAA